LTPIPLDPYLENIENAREIEAVIRRGRYLDRAALDEMLKAAK